MSQFSLHILTLAPQLYDSIFDKLWALLTSQGIISEAVQPAWSISSAITDWCSSRATLPCFGEEQWNFEYVDDLKPI